MQRKQCDVLYRLQTKRNEIVKTWTIREIKRNSSGTVKINSEVAMKVIERDFRGGENQIFKKIKKKKEINIK